MTECNPMRAHVYRTSLSLVPEPEVDSLVDPD